MTLIVDASVAAKWYLAEVDSDLVQRLFESGHHFLAPELLLAELANTLFKAWVRGAISDAHLDQALSESTKSDYDVLASLRFGRGCDGDFADHSTSGL